MVAPAQSGTHTSGRETYGDTLIVDYWGQVLARLPQGCGVITADIDLAKQAETRGALSGARQSAARTAGGMPGGASERGAPA